MATLAEAVVTAVDWALIRHGYYESPAEPITLKIPVWESIVSSALNRVAIEFRRPEVSENDIVARLRNLGYYREGGVIAPSPGDEDRRPAFPKWLWLAGGVIVVAYLGRKKG